MQKKLDKASGSVKKDAANKAPKAKAKGKCKSKACEPKHDAEPDEGRSSCRGAGERKPGGPGERSTASDDHRVRPVVGGSCTLAINNLNSSSGFFRLIGSPGI